MHAPCTRLRAHQRHLAPEDVVAQHGGCQPPLLTADMAEDVQRWVAGVVHSPLGHHLVAQQPRVEAPYLLCVVLLAYGEPQLARDVVVCERVSPLRWGCWLDAAGAWPQGHGELACLKGGRFEESQRRAPHLQPCEL